jgi:hypothetical protein
MGLDMTIYRCNKEGEKWETKNEVGYWRKFNALHLWFVKDCQNGIDDCGFWEVTKEKLQEIYGILRVSIVDKEPGIVPGSGFFFGSTDVNDDYWKSCENAMVIFSKLLEETDFDKQKLVYHASW